MMMLDDMSLNLLVPSWVVRSLLGVGAGSLGLFLSICRVRKAKSEARRRAIIQMLRGVTTPCLLVMLGLLAAVHPAAAQTILLNSAGPAITATSASLAYVADDVDTTAGAKTRSVYGAVTVTTIGGQLWGPSTPGYSPLPVGFANTLRYGPSFSYTFSGLQNGPYVVTLYFVEPNKTGVGQRVFSVTANGVVSPMYDVWKLAGGAKKVWATSLAASVFSGVLDLKFQTQLAGQNAIVSAVEVRQLAPKLRQVVETVTLPTPVPSQALSNYRYMLKNFPYPGSYVMVLDTGYGGFPSDHYVLALADASSKDVLINTDMPLAAGESLRVLYWTAE